MSEDIVDWAARTHRILASSADFYRGKLSVDPQGTIALLKTLYAVEPDVAAMLPGNRPVAAAASTLSYRAAAAFPPGDAYRANPLIDDIKRSRPALYAVASAEAAPPTLFASGDLPVYTASGVEPAALAKIPWMTARRGLGFDDRGGVQHH